MTQYYKKGFYRPEQMLVP